MDDATAARSRLIRTLQHAYSGERAAAYAYRGHSRASSDPDERAHIARIEAEEWHHREQVRRLLNELGAAPRRARELRAMVIGRTLQALCHVTGWFAPMYGAGKLERRNIVEYEDAARDAIACGRADFIDCLLEMAEVEWDHEAYFRAKVAGHFLTRLFPDLARAAAAGDDPRALPPAAKRSGLMDLARACAELGVTPSASLREAKRAYKKLVRRWHPDRFARSDAQAQAEATLRLQRITEAYQVIAHALGPGAAVASVLGGDGTPRYEPGARLPREEVERLVRSLGNEGPLDAFLKQPMWWWPLPFGVVFLLSTRSPAYEWLFAGGILLIAVTPILWWLERRRPFD